MVKVKTEPCTSLETSASPQPRSYQELVAYLNPIASPLAPRKLCKRVYKLVKKACKQKQIRRGVKEVQKFLNKGEKGILVLAGDTQPIEVYCHLPIMCEDRSIPYVYIPSKLDLGLAAGSKRPTCVILVKAHEDYQEAYDECAEEVAGLPMPM
ncbi:H/ACA ribonucleoprotein complex subunit 2 [Ambystoma mexicanum]|uniref:H/ACA ribonucleoprotein complex subunit 2 n=1 Tax=Ambystoma mexicanum TaxID=8296 RepID=UPI0037E97EDB